MRKSGWPPVSKNFPRKKDAEDWARSVEDEMRRGLYVDRSVAEKTTIKDALERYLAEVSTRKARGSVARETSTAKPLIKELGAYSLAAMSMSPDVISGYRDKRLKTKTQRGPMMSKNQVRLELALLSHMFTVAIREWNVGLTVNPVKSIWRPKEKKKSDIRLHPRMEETLLQGCKNFPNPKLYWIVGLALETAMRKSEIQYLTQGQVHLNKGIIHLPETKNGDARSIPLTPFATQILQGAINASKMKFDTDLVFWGNSFDENGRRKPYQFDEAWSKVRKELDMMWFNFHRLRHEAISRMIEKGFSDQEVAAISGHKCMDMVAHYRHLRASHLVDRVKELGYGREI